jgi:hypothetical protein
LCCYINQHLQGNTAAAAAIIVAAKPQGVFNGQATVEIDLSSTMRWSIAKAIGYYEYGKFSTNQQYSTIDRFLGVLDTETRSIATMREVPQEKGDDRLQRLQSIHIVED